MTTKGLFWIRWVDSHGLSDGPWHDADKIPHGEVRCESVGWVLADTNDTLTIVAHRGVENTNLVGGVMMIPKRAILLKRRLR